MRGRVSERGQITIDRAFRKRLGIEAGMVAHQRIFEGHLEVIFLPAPHHESLFGALHREGEQPRVIDSEQLEEAVMEAIADGPETAENGHG